MLRAMISSVAVVYFQCWDGASKKKALIESQGASNSKKLYTVWYVKEFINILHIYF
jgi:hypothetical protein